MHFGTDLKVESWHLVGSATVARTRVSSSQVPRPSCKSELGNLKRSNPTFKSVGEANQGVIQPAENKDTLGRGYTATEIIETSETYGTTALTWTHLRSKGCVSCMCCVSSVSMSCF